MSDLIKRLGASCYLAFEDGTNDYSAAQEAIDRIEELVKERDELGRKLNTARYGQPDFAWAIHEEAMADLVAKLTTCEKYRDAYAECDRIGTQAVRDLEAKLTKAVEALRWYDDGFTARKARDVLAELEVKE